MQDFDMNDERWASLLKAAEVTTLDELSVATPVGPAVIPMENGKKLLILRERDWESWNEYVDGQEET